MYFLGRQLPFCIPSLPPLPGRHSQRHIRNFLRRGVNAFRTGFLNRPGNQGVAVGVAVGVVVGVAVTVAVCVAVGVGVTVGQGGA